MVIKSNILAAFASRQLNINDKSKAKSTEKLASGYRINRAADNAAGLAISEKMRAQIRGLNRGAQNVQDGISFCNTAEGALNEVHSILQRIRELSVQAANDTYVTADRISINEEVTMLKKEINRISQQTEFNTYNIFTTPFEVNFSDDIFVVQIFDANDGDPADPDSYGGIIINSAAYGEDTRVSWDKINPDMVRKDASGKTVFNEGTYTYNTGSCNLEIQCKKGTKPPEIKVSFPVIGTDNGIEIAGQLVEWDDILNENNESIVDNIGESGVYHFNFRNGVGSFYVKGFESLDTIKNGINNCNRIYGRKYINEYDGYYKAQAIDIKDIGSSLRVNNDIAQNLVNKKELDVRLKADEIGVWLVDVKDDGSDGNELANSKKTWENLGITSWDSKNDISDIKTYYYTYKSNTDDSGYNIRFKFNLLDETSKESVIAGINNANVVDKDIKIDAEYTFSFTPAGKLTSGTLKSSQCNVSLSDEIAFKRNFNQQVDVFAEGDLTYDENNKSFTLKFKDKNGNPNSAVELQSSSITSMESIKNGVQPYLDYLLCRQIPAAIGNQNITTPTLSDVLGSSNINSNTTADVSKTEIYATQKMSGVCPVASMDFSGLNKPGGFQLYDLLGTGFNSTCATCTNHYSVMFVYGNTDKVASNGIRYSKSNDGKNNYTLKIDIKSMMEKNIDANTNNDITDGNSFTKALIGVMKSSNFDFHYQQYAADGGKLYVYDNRNRQLGSFDTKPYDIDNCTVDITLNGDKGNLQLQYGYDLNSLGLGQSPVTQTVESANGLFVKKADGTYELYDKTNTAHANQKRYDIQMGNLPIQWEQTYKTIMQGIADNTQINIKANDYDYVGYYAKKRPNSATVSTFDFYIEDTKRFWIQAGANTNQGVALDWKGFTTYTLGIGTDDTLTQKSSEKLLGDIDGAVETISQMRSIFGAYTNRMEHMYSIDTNTAENLQSAESKIRDADIADEMVRVTAQDILLQATQAMLAQANKMKDGMLQLLQ